MIEAEVGGTWSLMGQDWRLWLVAFMSVVSLIWNEANRRKTKNTADKIRSENVKLDEFRSSVKDPLSESLEVLHRIALRADAISVNSKPLEEQGEEVAQIRDDAIVAVADLETRLFDADDSEFAGAGDWSDGFEGCQDTVYQSMDAICSNELGEDARRQALARFKSATFQFRKSQRKKMSDEVKSITGIQ
ncbi:MAG: hypothetical protein GYB51_13235 [Rhodobacteraceae bacterium]|nr:hypothetical protein [Paracoccaceae bacterium]